MGGPGSGQLTKLINQLVHINCAALAEDPADGGEDGSRRGEGGRGHQQRHREEATPREFFIPRILEDSFSDGYPMQHAYKDLVSAAELGAKLGIPMPVLAAATATYQMALLKGHGSDKGGMIRVFEELLGVEFRKDTDCVTPTVRGASQRPNPSVLRRTDQTTAIAISPATCAARWHARWASTESLSKPVVGIGDLRQTSGLETLA